MCCMNVEHECLPCLANKFLYTYCTNRSLRPRPPGESDRKPFPAALPKLGKRPSVLEHELDDDGVLNDGVSSACWRVLVLTVSGDDGAAMMAHACMGSIRELGPVAAGGVSASCAKEMHTQGLQSWMDKMCLKFQPDEFSWPKFRQDHETETSRSEN